MRIPRVYTPHILTSGQLIELDEASSHHLSKVLRMLPGRELVVFNGEGGEYSASITQINKKTVSVALENFSAENRESPLKLELAIGISRGERMDWILQKATEMGVTRIAPLFAERTEVKLAGERLMKKMMHWKQIIISAAEQSQRNILPELTDPLNLDVWLQSAEADFKFVLHHRDNKGLPAQNTAQSVALLIGPEGGLSASEIESALGKNFSPLTLGPRVLRTETAPIAAISLVQYRWGDYQSASESAE